MPTSSIPYINFGDTGQPVFFLHANGYPPACYRPLLTQLAKTNRIIAMIQRPLWEGSQPEKVQDWTPLTDDLLRFLDENASHSPIIVIGHSMGGTALLRAALREPERFKAIVLLDPVLFPPYMTPLWYLMYNTGLGYRLHPLVATAKRRRREFDDLDRLFKGFRRKHIFRYMGDEALQAYVEGITCKTGKGSYQLCYSAEWEARLYVTAVWRDMDIWRGLPKLRVPTLIIRGSETDTFWDGTARRMKRKQPKVRVETLEKSTHLVPLERPKEVSYLIQSVLHES